MKKFIIWLRTPETLLRAAISVMCIYMVHNAYILDELEVLDLSFELPYSGSVYKVKVFNALLALSFSLITEFVVLVLIVNGKKQFSRFYALATFGLNTFYYLYFAEEITWPIAIVAVFVSFIHLCAIWYLGEEFHKIKFESSIKPAITLIREKPEASIRPIAKVQPDIIEDRTDSKKIYNPILEEIVNGCELHGDGSYTCKFCDTTLRNKFTLKRHIQRAHEEELQVESSIAS